MTNWIAPEEAIELIMQREGCSRRTARRKLAKAMKDGSLRHRKVPLQTEPPLAPEDAVQRLQDDPESVVMPLSEMVRAWGYKPQELLGELRAGRLVACPINESALLKVELGEMTSADDFVVTAAALIEWIANPATPEHLRAKCYGKMQ